MVSVGWLVGSESLDCSLQLVERVATSEAGCIGGGQSVLVGGCGGDHGKGAEAGSFRGRRR